MLSSACRRFRARFSPGPGPGSAHPHRHACRECEAFAAALESAAGVRLPLPASLRRNLRAIAGPEPEAVLPFAVPRLPVPDALVRRLRGIASPGRPAPPEWVLNPRYAVAASALLALLLGPFFAAAAHRSLQAVDTVQAQVRPLLRRTEEGSRQEIGKLRLTANIADTACDTAYEKARRSVAGTLGRLDDGLSGFSVRLSNLSIAVSKNFANRGPGRKPAGSVRRPK